MSESSARGWSRLLACIAWAAVAAPALAIDVSEEIEEVEGLPAIATTGDIIRTIEFVGNKVTRSEILEQEMLIRVGDIADPLLIERSRQAIMDLGLFTSVRALLESAEDGTVLRIVVKEKFYVLPVPKLNRDEENNFSLGAEIAIDNLSGLNQQLKARWESEQADSVSGGDVNTSSLSYSYPRVLGSSYNLSAELSKESSPIDIETGVAPTISVYDREARAASFQVSRWLALRGPSRGWLVGGGLVWRRNSYDYISGTTGMFQDSQAVGVSVRGQFVDVHDYLYSRSGVDYGYAGEFSLKSLGSDTQYTRHEFYYRRYWLLDGRPHENIDMQWRLGLSSGGIFPGDLYAYSIGGNKALRGYDRLDVTGNAYTILNLQYLRPLFGYYTARGVIFLDVGNAYESNAKFHIGDLRWDIGIGLRLRVKSLVKIDLRVDMSYAYDTGETKVFAGTREMF